MRGYLESHLRMTLIYNSLFILSNKITYSMSSCFGSNECRFRKTRSREILNVRYHFQDSTVVVVVNFVQYIVMQMNTIAHLIIKNSVKMKSVKICQSYKLNASEESRKQWEKNREIMRHCILYYLFLKINNIQPHNLHWLSPILSILPYRHQMKM